MIRSLISLSILISASLLGRAQSFPLSKQDGEILADLLKGSWNAGGRSVRWAVDPSERERITMPANMDPVAKLDTAFEFTLQGMKHRWLIAHTSWQGNQCEDCGVWISQIRLKRGLNDKNWTVDGFDRNFIRTGYQGEPPAYSLFPITHQDFALAMEDSKIWESGMISTLKLVLGGKLLIELVLGEASEDGGVEYAFETSFNVDKARGLVTFQRYGTRPAPDKNGKTSVQPIKETIRYVYKGGVLIRQ